MDKIILPIGRSRFMDMRALVGRNVAYWRKAKGLTQEGLAERSGFGQNYISSLERGRRNPTVITLFELARALDRNPVDLLAPEQTVQDCLSDQHS